MAYHLATNGSDEADGKTPATAWKTLARAERMDFRPGDRLVLESGATFSGTLAIRPGLLGAAGKPIEITTDGPVPATIAAGNGPAILLASVAHVRVSRLVLTGAGRRTGNTASGLKAARCRHVTIEDVTATGFLKGGIDLRNSDDVTVLRVTARDNGHAGIMFAGGFDPADYSQNLRIAYCRCDDNPGDPTNLANHSGNGIVVGGVRDAVIEHCEASGNGWDMPREGNGPVGIWGHNAARMVIRHCVSHHNKTSPRGMDGGGFDLDGGVTDSVIEDCLSYFNEGPGYLIYQYPGAPRWEHNVVRNCVSVNDGAKNKGCVLIGNGDTSVPVRDIVFEHNVFINELVPVLDLWGNVPGAFRRNVLVGTKGLFAGTIQDINVGENCVWNPETKAAPAADAPWGMFTDPLLDLPASWRELPADWEGLKAMTWFRTKSRSMDRGGPWRAVRLGLPA